MAKNQPTRLKNWHIAVISALTALVALATALLALFIGLWLDSVLGRRGPATIAALVISVPLSLWLMVRVALKLMRRYGVPPQPISLRHETSSKEE